MCLESTKSSGRLTPSLVSLVFSIGTIHSQPSGILAPVIIFMPKPSFKISLESSPAKIVCFTFTDFPASAILAAYPSIAELLKGGRLYMAITSWAKTNPRACSIGSIFIDFGDTFLYIISSASSTLNAIFTSCKIISVKFHYE